MMMMMEEEQEANSRHQQQHAQSSRCLLLLQQSLAIQLTRGPPPQIMLNSSSQPPAARDHDCQFASAEHPADEMWMYDKGYNLFQAFLEANSRCWWNAALVEATRQLRYRGHCAPGVLMVGGPACALEVLRAAWARNVLRPPADHVITSLGDIEDCLVAPVAQGQFTPLPEALCWAILELTSQRQAATLDTLRSALRLGFPQMQRPSRDMVYDALAKLMQERKIYHTAQGYFVVSPEARRLRRHDSCPASGAAVVSSSSRRARHHHGQQQAGMLMSNDEAVTLVHGEMLTVRDGSVTHQAVQTNLADVICGGNPNDKVLFARCRSVPSRLERRHSLRLWASARRLNRSGSSRSLPRRPDRSDTSSSAEYASTDSAPHSPTKKIGLLSRLFRRSTRRASSSSSGGGKGPLMGTFSAQYPPTEWFNPRVVHLHSVATQTRAASPSMTEEVLGSESQASFRVWDDCESSIRSATLPRRHHRRQPSVDSASLLANSTPRSSRRHRSPCSTLPRSSSRCTSRAANAKTNSSNSSPSRSGGSSGSVRPAPSSTLTAGLPPAAASSLSNSPARRHSSRHSSVCNGSSPQHKLLHKSSSSSCSSTSSPLKLIQQQMAPLQEAAQNSITLQVSTNLSPSQEQRAPSSLQSVQSSVTLASNASSTTTISGSPGTKIYVHQNNSPMRSVITFENSSSSQAKPNKDKQQEQDKQDKEKEKEKEKEKAKGELVAGKEEEEGPQGTKKVERPSSLYGKSESDKENKPARRQQSDQLDQQQELLLLSSSAGKLKLTNNRLNNSQAQLQPLEANHEQAAMNNSRKLSLSLSKDALSYRNLLRQPPSQPTSQQQQQPQQPATCKNNSSNPPSPTKQPSFQAFGGSFNNVYIDNLLDKQQLAQGSEPNLDKTASERHLYSYPSLSDMQVQFTSLAAQKILKGCPLNSVDTLVEVNMAAATDKPNNCDLTVHTDFGLV